MDSTILQTGAVAVVSALIGGAVPAIFSLAGASAARRTERRIAVADLAGELLECIEKYRGTWRDHTTGEFLNHVQNKAGARPRSSLTREREDLEAELHGLSARIAARSRKLGRSASKIVLAAKQDEGWQEARAEFIEALTGTVR